jgi:hypothetical protein
MLLKRFVIVLCALAAGCTVAAAPVTITPETGVVAQAVGETAARECPWPADLAHYEQTTLAVRHQGAVAPDLGVLHDTKIGCGVLTFTVDDRGIVNSSNVVAEYPAGFGTVASDVLRWNDYVTPASSLMVFMVRLGAQKQPDGSVMMLLAFKDSTIAIVVPRSAGW